MLSPFRVPSVHRPLGATVPKRKNNGEGGGKGEAGHSTKIYLEGAKEKRRCSRFCFAF